MAVAVYKLRIRDASGDDSRWQEARVVAASLAEALTQAQQRFGDERVMAIEQDAAGEPVTDADADAHAAYLAAAAHVDAYVGTAPPPSRVEALVAAVESGDVGGTTGDAPMPWEGRWRPTVLIWAGVAAGVLLFAGWYQFGTPAHKRFVTAGPATTASAPGLELGEDAPRGGVLAATGVPVRERDDGDLGTVVGESVASLPGEAGHGDGAMPDDTADDVRTIGTLVGEMFARWPEEEDEPADPPPYRAAQPSEPYYEPRASVPDPLPLPPETIASREASVLRPFFVGVDRGGGIIETLRVTAYDRDHAREIVAGLPERPAIVRGPSPQLSW